MDLFKELVIADYMFAKDKIFANLTLSDEEMRLYEKVWSLSPKRSRNRDDRHPPDRAASTPALPASSSAPGRSRSRSRPITSGSSPRPTTISSTTTGRPCFSSWTRTR